MELRIHRFVVWALIPAFAAAEAAPLGPELYLQLPSPATTSEECVRLIQSFTKEAREVLPDTTVILSVQGRIKTSSSSASAETYLVDCDRNDPLVLGIKKSLGSSGFSEFRFRFSSITRSFLATDWLVFQRRRIAPLTLNKTPSDQLKMPPMAVSTASIPEEKSGSIVQKWWFWAGIGVLAAGTGFLIHRGQQPDRMAIEIR